MCASGASPIVEKSHPFTIWIEFPQLRLLDYPDRIFTGLCRGRGRRVDRDRLRSCHVQKEIPVFSHVLDLTSR